MPFDPSVFTNVRSKLDYDREAEEFMLRKQLQQAQINKAQEIDVDKMGEQAFWKAAQGQELSPQEMAAARWVDAKSGGISFNPVTGDITQKPRISDKIGLGDLPPAQPNEQFDFSQFPPISESDLTTPGLYGRGGRTSPPPLPTAAGGLTTRGRQTFMDEGIKADRKRVDEMVSGASSASAAKSSAQRMQALQGQAGYTGFGATPLNWADKALTGMGAPNLIKGDPAAREMFKAESVGQWVKAVEPLKGALTEREGARFDAAIPSLTMTSSGIKMMNDLTVAMGQRAQEKSQFYQDYFNQNGTLNGADQQWNAYADANPIIPESFGAAKETPYNLSPKIAPTDAINELRRRGKI